MLGGGSGCRAPESSEHGVLVVPAAVGTADRALGVPAPGGSGEEERWGGLSARRGDAAPGGSGRQGEWALRGTGCWTPGGANTGGAETLRAAGRRCLVQSGALGLPGVGRLWGAGGQRGRQGSAGPASLLGEQPLGCKGAVAFWSSLGVLMAGGGLAPSPRLCLRPGSSGDNGTQRPAAGGCSPYLSLWSLSRWGWRGGCLQEIFGAGGVSGTGLPGPPGSAQLRTLTGRSCLISPSPPGLAQADPIA